MRMKKERLWWFRAHFSIDSCTTASRHIDRIKAQYLKHVVREQWINKCIDYNLNNGCWDHTCRPASLCCILKPCSGFISNVYLRIKITAYQINNRLKITAYEKTIRNHWQFESMFLTSRVNNVLYFILSDSSSMILINVSPDEVKSRVTLVLSYNSTLLFSLEPKQTILAFFLFFFSPSIVL